MEIFIFIFISLILYLLLFFLLPKMKFPEIIKIIFVGWIGGSYLNIADKGNVAKWLNLELTDTIRLISMIIVCIYFVSAWFVFIKPKKDDEYSF